MGKTVRLNFLVRPEVRALLDSLLGRIRADSLTEVLRRSLEMYSWLASCYERGLELVVRHPDGSISEVVLPEFLHLLRRGKVTPPENAS